MPHSHSLLRRVVGGFAAALLATSGLFVASAVQTTPAAAAYPETFNPFSLAGGFTVYAREDLTLDNDETEGSLAAGGTTTLTKDTYSIIHIAAGTGAYTLPTVDGDPTRLLTGVYDPSSRGLMRITSAGTSDPALQGDLKMVDRDGPWQAFQSSDWLRLNLNPADVDQLPLIDATHQDYPADAEFPAGPSGNGSIYTFDQSPNAVANYVEANADANYDEAKSCLDGLLDPSNGYQVGVAEDVGDRVVLEPLSADRPNVVDYADIKGAKLIQFSAGPTPGATNPLIIRVPAGTLAVTGASTDEQGKYSPYMFWDLSELTGNVTVTGYARIDGSIYAPDANVTVDAAPLDGQVLGENVTLLGGEVHSFLFAGTIACTSEPSGTFAVAKSLIGIGADDLPEGFTFTVNYTATTPAPDSEVTTGALKIPADGTPVAAGEDFPVGTVVTFQELTPVSIPGFVWTGLTIDPSTITIGEGTSQLVTVTNTAEALPAGTFSVAKVVEGIEGAIEGSVQVDWVARFGAGQVGEGTLTVPLDGTVVEAGETFPVGTVIVLTEDTSTLPPVPGFDWSGVDWDPGSVLRITEGGQVVAATVTNTLVPEGPRAGVSIVKTVDDPALDEYDYTITYGTTPGEPPTTTITLPVDEPVTLDLPADATTLVIQEDTPTQGGVPVDVTGWDDPVFRFSVDGVAHEPVSAGFGEPVELPIGTDGPVSIDVRNSLKQGTFTIAKEIQGIPGDLVPPGLEFNVAWTATTPSGDVWTGVMSIPGDGTPTSPVDENGDALQFPYGTVITYKEVTAPSVRGLAWGERSFSPESLVIGEGDRGVVGTTLTNSATAITGTFEVTKALVGIDPEDLLVDTITISYVAWSPFGGTYEGSFDVPTDGTPAGPTADGGPVAFPLGTIVLLEELTPPAGALPPGYEWTGTTWSPSNFVVIGADETAQVEVTNTVQQLTRYSIVKSVSGSGASAIPAGAAFTIDWWIDGVPQTRFDLPVGEVLTSDWLPVSSIVEGQEVASPTIPGVDWGTPSWTVDGQVLTPEPNGRIVIPSESIDDQSVVAISLDNDAQARPLPATGGGGIPPIVPVGALAFILVGIALVAARRRSA